MRPVRSNDRFQQRDSHEKHSINGQIRAPEVRVIDADGTQLGVMRTIDAIRKAEDSGFDLVEVGANLNPPVCKILDYGKLKYREQKKAADARKKAAVTTVKELRVRYNTDKHDIEVKVKSATKFLQEGDKVRFSMRFRGREVVYKELGEEVFKQLADRLSDIALIEEMTPLLGQKMIMVLSPRPLAKQPTKSGAKKVPG
jgi:translation initiation factor IF-3